MDNSGLAQVRAHAGTDGHKDKVNVVSGTKKVKVNSGTKKYDNIFSGSKIAESYKQGETKIKCAIQFGMALFMKEQLIKDFKLQPFSIRFDETTTSQVKTKV